MRGAVTRQKGKTKVYFQFIVYKQITIKIIPALILCWSLHNTYALVAVYIYTCRSQISYTRSRTHIIRNHKTKRETKTRARSHKNIQQPADIVVAELCSPIPKAKPRDNSDAIIQK